jgi:hypothetical protein
MSLPIKSKGTDIVFLTLPRLELRAPITAPALLKACVESAGFTSLCMDLNLDLWHSVDPKVHGHVWFDTDLTFRHEDKFLPFWNEVIAPQANKWIEELRQINPRWVGMTIFSQRSKWIAREVVRLIKDQLPHIKIVTGGPFSEFVSPPLFKEGLVDAYVIGEGEQPIVDILQGKSDRPGINGNPPEQNNDLDKIPIPNYDDFDFKLYPKGWNDPRIRDESNMGTEFIYITGSRGCVRRCEFCDIANVWPKFRYRSGKNIADEMMRQNNKYGSKRFLFTDSLLNGSVSQLKELCQTLIEYRKAGKMGPVRWQGQFIARPKQHMSAEVYQLMKEAGCFFVSIGVESGSEKVRNDMKKMFDDEALDFTFNACAENGIEMAWLLLVGYPTETEADFQRTLDLLDRYNWINKKGLVRSVALGPTLDIVPGSPLYKKQEQMGITWDDHKNWVYGDNNRIVRIQRGGLKDKCLELDYPVVEKATEHLLQELKAYGYQSPEQSLNIYDHYNEIPGSMDRAD